MVRIRPAKARPREDGVDESEALAEQPAAAHGEVPDLSRVDPQDQGPVDRRNADHHAEQDRGNPVEFHGSLLGGGGGPGVGAVGSLPRYQPPVDGQPEPPKDRGQLIPSSLARISSRLNGLSRLDTRAARQQRADGIVAVAGGHQHRQAGPRARSRGRVWAPFRPGMFRSRITRSGRARLPAGPGPPARSAAVRPGGPGPSSGGTEATGSARRRPPAGSAAAGAGRPAPGRRRAGLRAGQAREAEAHPGALARLALDSRVPRWALTVP